MNQFELFVKALIEDGSCMTILRGLGVTAEISFLSIVIGTILGAFVCMMRLQNNAVIQVVAKVYIAVLRGSPVLLLLMIMYYVVFARSTLSAPLIAVAAFSLNMSAHTAECFRGAFSATDKMQVEAARTLGFSKWQAFRLISLPQMIRIAKPSYQSVLVNLIQWTSIVGYVSITDLTRVINNIGSRTMQPLFMIIIGILLYLALAYVCYGIFALADMISEQRKRRRKSK